MTGALVVQADALRLPLPDASVDLIVTSPPYFALRAYDAGAAQIGSEPTPHEYLEALWAATAEMTRVLKPTGSMFVDLGDKYNSAASGQNGLGKSTLGASKGPGNRASTQAYAERMNQSRGAAVRDAREKSLLLLPERYRVGCVDRLGLIARAVICWNKPNGLPESVQDRVRRSHEDWVHLTKQPRYYSAIDEVREPHTMRPQRRQNGHKERQKLGVLPAQTYSTSQRDELGVDGHPLGKLPGSVWEIPSEPLNLPGYFVAQDGQLVDFLAPTRGGRRGPHPNGHHPGLFELDAYAELIVGEDANAWRWMRATGVTSSPWPKVDTGLQLHTGADHYAAFPTRWPEQLIKGFSPPGICLDCGQGRVPVVDRGEIEDRKGRKQRIVDLSLDAAHGHDGRGGERWKQSATILGYACSCTPFTDHPGTGESSGPDGRYGDAINRGERYPGSDVHGGLGVRPRVGPWREYHLDRWTPPPTRPAIICDPFGGTGTTAMVARALGRIGLSFDLSHAYSRAARWRIWSDDAAKAISRTNLERQQVLL